MTTLLNRINPLLQSSNVDKDKKPNYIKTKAKELFHHKSYDVTKKETIATRMANKLSSKFNLSIKSRLVISMGLNFTMGTVWTVAALVGGSSFLLAEAADSFGDSISYGISLFTEKKSNKAKAMAVAAKAAISLGFAGAAMVFGVVRFVLKWGINPFIGLGFSLGGIAVNAMCALLLKDNHKEQGDEGTKILHKSNWRHTIVDLKTGLMGVGFSVLDILGVPFADVTGGIICGGIQAKTALSMFKQAKELWGLHKQEKAEKNVVLVSQKELNIEQSLPSPQIAEVNVNKIVKSDLQNVENVELSLAPSVNIENLEQGPQAGKLFAEGLQNTKTKEKYGIYNAKNPTEIRLSY